uniref:SFRICE_025079 n=1 Tax=Spodoptera frugiperda TaxID=7108 RepID=A0A2H1WD03_SPOFR
MAAGITRRLVTRWLGILASSKDIVYGIRAIMSNPFVNRPSIVRLFPYKKPSLDVSIATSAKLHVPMNMIGGNQTHPQQRSIAHLWWKSTLKLHDNSGEFLAGRNN